MARLRFPAVVALFMFFLALCKVIEAQSTGDAEGIEEKGISVPEAKNLGPWARGLLKNIPASAGPTGMVPHSTFPLTLAGKRTRRPDILNKFRVYEGGWNITNRHYWASVGFTGAAGFIVAPVWFLSFGVALLAHFCCKWRGGKDKGVSLNARRLCLALLLVFTCAAAAGCILLTVGQDKFHNESLNTLGFVVNQSDFTVQVLRNVTDYLTLASTINVGPIFLPLDIQQQIIELKGDLDSAANTVSNKTEENYSRVRLAITDVRHMLIVVASLMLVLAVLGFLFSVFGHKHAIYIFVMSGWLLVAITFVLFGMFVIINSAAEDTCTAMDEWVRYPQAETALSNILPCVNEKTTNQTLYQTKQVVVVLVKIVNRVISSMSRNSSSTDSKSNQGQKIKYRPVLPYLCSPYDTDLNDRDCKSREVPIANASSIWQNYTCTDYDTSSCAGGKTIITPETYEQLVMAANVSYALYHYAPLLLNFQDCKFVRDTFSSITTNYCPKLERNLRVVCAGLALISVGVMLCLVLWVFYADRPRREEVFVVP